MTTTFEETAAAGNTQPMAQPVDATDCRSPLSKPFERLLRYFSAIPALSSNGNFIGAHPVI